MKTITKSGLRLLAGFVRAGARGYRNGSLYPFFQLVEVMGLRQWFAVVTWLIMERGPFAPAMFERAALSVGDKSQKPTPITYGQGSLETGCGPLS